MKSVFVIDNYDSFTFNLVELLRAIGVSALEVKRNDQFSMDELQSFDLIMLSPGPGIPSEAGLMPRVVKHYASSKPILGVCLGHQCIAESFGGALLNVDQPFHAKRSEITVLDTDDYLFRNLPKTFTVGRYHSWVVDAATLPPDLIVTARDELGLIMALRHRHLDVRGIQFHPESVLSEFGRELLGNWIQHGGEPCGKS